MAISKSTFENVGMTLQALAVEWLKEVDETEAADWFEQHWTGDRSTQRKMAAGTCIMHTAMSPTTIALSSGGDG